MRPLRRACAHWSDPLRLHAALAVQVTGNVTEQPPDATKQLTFAAVVREEQVQSIEVKNDTDQLWKIRPNVLTEKPAGAKSRAARRAAGRYRGGPCNTPPSSEFALSCTTALGNSLRINFLVADTAVVSDFVGPWLSTP